MSNRTVSVIENKDIKSGALHFQYVPGRFIREIYGADEETKLLIHNSPHYSFLKEYQKTGKKVLDNKTNYYIMHSRWGRSDKFIHGKASRFLAMYEHVKKSGPIGRIYVVKEPLYERTFDSGYEIYDGHHRASIYAVLGHKIIKCVIVAVKFK